MGVRAQLLHGVAVTGPPECEIAAPQAPWQREIQSVKLRRLPWGSQSLLGLGRIFTREEESKQPSPTPACLCNVPSNYPSPPKYAPEIRTAPCVPQPRSTSYPA